MELKKAERKRQNLRIAFMSPTGGGKTFTALRVAHAIAKREGGRVAVIDTEESSSELYADEQNPDGGRFDFDVIDLGSQPGKFSTQNYITALHTCAQAGAKVVVVDSASHAWAGEGGVLAFVDSKKGDNKFANWRDATPLQQQFVRALLTYPGHVLVTMRVKTEWVLEEDHRGKKVPRKVGMQPVQREGIEYEFTCVFDLEQDTKRLTVGKTRCHVLTDYTAVKAGADLANILLDWLDSAAVQEAPSAPAAVPEAPKHDPSWKGDQKWFFVQLKELGVTYDLVCELLEGRKQPRPSAMPMERRRSLLKWLAGPEGRQAYASLCLPPPGLEAALEERGMSLALVVAVCTDAERPDPGTLDEAGVAELLAWLDSDIGKALYAQRADGEAA